MEYPVNRYIDQEDTNIERTHLKKSMGMFYTSTVVSDRMLEVVHVDETDRSLMVVVVVALT